MPHRTRRLAEVTHRGSVPYVGSGSLQRCLSQPVIPVRAPLCSINRGHTATVARDLARITAHIEVTDNCSMRAKWFTCGGHEGGRGALWQPYRGRKRSSALRPRVSGLPGLGGGGPRLHKPPSALAPLVDSHPRDPRGSISRPRVRDLPGLGGGGQRLHNGARPPGDRRG
jgi:hypothetical protein